MRFVLSLAALVFVTLPSFAEVKTAKEVIAKAVEALGGEKAIKKYPASIVKSKGTIVVMGMELAFSSYEMSLDPDKQKSTITIEAGGQELKIVQTINGENVSMTFAGNDMEIPAEQKSELIEGVILGRVMQFVDLDGNKDFEVALGDMGKVDGKDAYVLTVKSKKLRETKLFIDAKTFLLAKIEKEGSNGAQEVGKQEWFPSDYKKVDGIMVPMKTKVLHEGKAFLDSEITEAKMLETLDKNEFIVGK